MSSNSSNMLLSKSSSMDLNKNRTRDFQVQCELRQIHIRIQGLIILAKVFPSRLRKFGIPADRWKHNNAMRTKQTVWNKCGCCPFVITQRFPFVARGGLIMTDRCVRHNS